MASTTATRRKPVATASGGGPRVASGGGSPLAAIGRLPRNGKIILGVAAALIVALLGFTVGLAVGRPSYPGEGSPDVGFARDMSTHHAQAVEMGMIAFQNATLPEVRTLGGDIAVTQEGQIGIMQGWLQTWGVPANTSAAPMSWMPGGAAEVKDNLMPGMATRDEIAKLKAAKGKDVDILFLQYMLRHHLGGIHMVDGVLAGNPRPEVRELAETMKKNQSGEVVVMQNMLASLGAKPLT
jgi:uncharacterized protein (DUF305 family)